MQGSQVAPIRVFVADESRSVRLLLSSLLDEDERFTVVGEESSGGAVLARCEEADLVVVDLVLSDMDAFTLIDELHARRPGLPIVVYAAADPPYLRDAASARGAAGYFTYETDSAILLAGFAAATGADGS